MTLTAADVAEIMRLVEQSTFDELTLEVDGIKLHLRRGGAAQSNSPTHESSAADHTHVVPPSPPGDNAFGTRTHATATSQAHGDGTTSTTRTEGASATAAGSTREAGANATSVRRSQTASPDSASTRNSQVARANASPESNARAPASASGGVQPHFSGAGSDRTRAVGVGDARASGDAIASSNASASAGALPTDPNVQDVTAPLLGTFFRAPKPGAPPFVVEGAAVEEDTVVAIIEVMKLMNTVRAGVRGTVAEILARDGVLVEYGETLLRVRKS